MNRRMVFHTVGFAVIIEAVLMLLPLAVALIYGESCVSGIGISIVIAFVLGLSLVKISKPGNKVIYAKEGFVITALSWFALSAVGALPFYLSREIPSYIDAFFETVSGFTTTGASILTDVEAMSKGLLFWRSFTHWVGGMGVLVFIMAIIPSLSDRSIHLLRAEVPGPVVGKLVPKMKQTTRILYIIYIVLTVVQIVFLLLGGMDFFESCLHAFGTAGTGGFGIKSDSIASYSPYVQWVITIFMLVFGVNFNLYYLVITKHFKTVLKSRELWAYIGIVAVCAGIITLNILPIYDKFSEAIRQASFQVSSVITTTGYSTADFNLWPNLSKTVIFLLMFVGGCAGSTAGGLKVARVIMLFKIIKNELQRMLHPRSVKISRFEGKSLESTTLPAVSSYLVIYAVFFCFFILLVGFNGFDIETTVTSVASCFNNVGPAFGVAGPASSYASFSAFSKVILSLAMLLGRLEIYPIILTLSASTWAKK